jgi:hypothetical protein
MMRSRRMRWAGHVAPILEERECMLVNDRKVRKMERELWEDQDMGVYMTVGWILEKRIGVKWLWTRISGGLL